MLPFRSNREKLRQLIRREIAQSPHHVENMINIFEIIREEWASEFYNDSHTTHNAMLRECYTEAKKRHLMKGYGG